ILKEDQDIYYRHRKQLSQSNVPQLFDLRMLKKDKTVFWAHLDAAAAQAVGGTQVFRIVISDITERKNLEAEKSKLQEQNRQLQKAESLDRMAGSIAHLFNNQLHVVLGYLNMVIGEMPPDDFRIEKLASAMEAAKKVSDVSVLMITYLGNKPGKIESTDLSELCRTSLPILQAGKPEDVVMETDLPSAGPFIRADPKQIQQMLNNLVINAWEAIGDGAGKAKSASSGAGGPVGCNAGTPAGIGGGAGTIHLGVRTVSHKDIPAAHRFPVNWQFQEQRYACMEVTDSGCGIKEEDIDKLFDPFFSTKLTGRGLGLSVVLGIVRAHNAVITVENRIEGGVVFRVYFPLSTQAAPAHIEQIVKAPDIVPGGTVLLVEDNEGVRKITALILVGWGFKVLQARNGVEAVEIFGEHKDEISCLLCDLTMPRMGGWETIAALRAIRHDLPVILASGYDEASVVAGEHSELPDFFLNKPYDLNKLRDKVGQAIARKTVEGKNT
ncbi:MAG: hybrid sensor histidine kinase/response regulator, partial [Terrimicrobiaceae bacterium]